MEVLKEAPRTGRQERSNRAALPCERVLFAPWPGGSPFVKTVARTTGNKKEINIEQYKELEKIPSRMIEDSTGLKGTMLNKAVTQSQRLRKGYTPVEQGKLSGYIKARPKEFYKKELDGLPGMVNEGPDYVLRIDRILRQPQDHPLLKGVSAAGCGDEETHSILDEFQGRGSGFLKKMNLLRANGEVPVLFEWDGHTAMMTQNKGGAWRKGLVLNTNDELYQWFIQKARKCLPVGFIMNLSTDGLKGRATTSPTIFNRYFLKNNQCFWGLYSEKHRGLEKKTTPHRCGAQQDR